MPELPEVQTTVDDLNRKVRGRRIVAAWHDWPKFKAVEKAKGHTISGVRRLAKNILFHLGDSHLLLVHQKMTGHLLVGKWQIEGRKIIPLAPAELKEKVNNYIHFILTLDNGQMIGFSDLRKFGKVVFGTKEEIEDLPDLKKLGPDALAVNYRQFAERVRKRRKTIYQTLMDQTVISGIGNIYANDILWQARLSPFKLASRLTGAELKLLHRTIKPILVKAFKARGTSIDDYRDTAGKKGRYAASRLVYQREGESCRRCRATILRKKQGGRSVHYCPKCQGR